MTRLLLVRHGTVESDSPGRHWGHTDVPLSAHGVWQAERVRDRLAKERIVAIYSSDLRRALDTAAIIAAPHGVPVVPCAELREVGFGRFEGLTFDEIMTRDPEAERLWSGACPELRFPGGESLAALVRRVDHFAEGLSNRSLTETVLVVAHGGPLRVLVCRLAGLDPSHWWRIRIDPASLTVLETCAEGAAVCLLNDVCHLDTARRYVP